MPWQMLLPYDIVVDVITTNLYFCKVADIIVL